MTAQGYVMSEGNVLDSGDVGNILDRNYTLTITHMQDSDNHTLRGLATVSYYAAAIKNAKTWYSELLGVEPYFQRPDSENPVYIEFRIGDYQHELGIIDIKYAPKNGTMGPGGEIAYWHVDDVAATFEKLLAMGAKEYEPIINRGADFITASVVDPFGNILGIMNNPHYLEILRLKGG
jgi:predicted enzyme related to lactoylglutathione lyase